MGYVFLGVFVVAFAIAFIFSWEPRIEPFNSLCLAIFTSLLASGAVSFSFDYSQILKRRRERATFLSGVSEGLASLCIYFILSKDNKFNVWDLKILNFKDLSLKALNNIDLNKNGDLKQLVDGSLSIRLRINAHISEIILEKSFLLASGILSLKEIDYLSYYYSNLESLNSNPIIFDYKEAFENIKRHIEYLLNDSNIFKKIFSAKSSKLINLNKTKNYKFNFNKSIYYK